MTSPVGTWEPSQLIGAKVKVKSMSLRSSLFGFDSDSIYVITDIGFRMSKLGKAYGVVYLDGFGTKEFVWKDLEILSLDTTKLFADNSVVVVHWWDGNLHQMIPMMMNGMMVIT